MKPATYRSVLIALATLAVSVCPQALSKGVHPGTAAGTSAADVTGGSAAAHQKPLVTASELLSELRKRGLLTESDQQIEERLVRAILESASLNAPSPDGFEGARHEADSATELEGPWPLDDQTAYVKVLNVGRGFSDKVGKLADGGELSDSRAVVIDLRAAKGNGHIAEIRDVPAMPAFAKKPCAVLVDSGTMGAAEVLAEAFAARKNVVLVGQPTCGRPYSTVEINLSGQLSIPVPLLPEDKDSATWPPRPIVPDLLAGPAKSADASLPETPPTTDSIAKDEALRRSLDMVSMAVAVGYGKDSQIREE